MGWDPVQGSEQGRAIFTDSGGFQAFALSAKRGAGLTKTTEEGIVFRSHLDGSKHFFSPEDVIAFEERIGVDIGTCLDVCTGFPETERTVQAAVDTTNRWAERSIATRKRPDMLLYGMVQGSIYPKLRERSALFLRDLPFDGFAIGGNMYTFGAPLAKLAPEKPKMWEILDLLADILPAEKPRHLLGVGEPADIIEGSRHGIDTFDCVMATRMARNGAVWLWEESLTSRPQSLTENRPLARVVLGGKERAYERVNLATSRFSLDTGPLTDNCLCAACTSGLTRAWFNHAFKIGETLAMRLATIHNLAFLQGIMREIRAEIRA